MPKETITFAVNGSLSLERFAVAMRRFTDLVEALNKEVGASGEVDWILDNLEYGSAIATARAVPKGDDDSLWLKVKEVIDSYLAVGQALESAGPVPFSVRVQQPAARVRQLLEGRDESIESIRFETEDDDVVIERAASPHPLPTRTWPYSFGAIEGRIQTLTMKGRLRFTLYDLREERAVSCYIAQDLTTAEQAAMMKEAWGHVAIVEGRIRRDPRTGRPQTVREIRRITPLAEPESGLYKNARGALKLLPGQMSPEEAIRRVRDA